MESLFVGLRSSPKKMIFLFALGCSIGWFTAELKPAMAETNAGPEERNFANPASIAACEPSTLRSSARREGVLGDFELLCIEPGPRAEIENIADQLYDAQWERLGKIKKASDKLRALSESVNLDEGKIIAVYQSIFELRLEIIRGSIVAWNDSVDLLTDEQKLLLQQLLHGTTEPRLR